MEIRLTGHESYHHEFHIVWIPKYRKKILKGELKSFIEKHLFEVPNYHPDVEIEKYSIQIDHVHLIIIIPPRYSVSEIVGKIKANTYNYPQKLDGVIRCMIACKSSKEARQNAQSPGSDMMQYSKQRWPWKQRKAKRP